MLPSYSELMNLDMFRYYAIGICIITAITCVVIYLWWALTGARQMSRDIIDNVNETTVIYDRHDNLCYINTTFDRRNIMKFLKGIDEKIDKSGLIPENSKKNCLNESTVSIYEGEIKPFTENDSIFSWKMCPIVRKHKYSGRIFVFNEITEYKNLLEQLDHKNRQLKDTLEMQRNYVQVAGKLVVEEERERIMRLLYKVAGEYLGQLQDSIERMKKYSAGSTQDDKMGFAAENDRMIGITRETIAGIRKTVKVLHVSE